MLLGVIVNSRISTNVNPRIDNLTNEIADLKVSMAAVQAALATLRVSSEINHIAETNPSAIEAKLPALRRALDEARKANVRISARDLARASHALESKYRNNAVSTADKSTIVDAMRLLTTASNDPELMANSLSENQLKDARNKGQLVENMTIDLSERQSWDNFVFLRCKIVILRPNEIEHLELKNVSFLGCDFGALGDDEASVNLLAIVLTNENPRITSVLANYGVSIGNVRLRQANLRSTPRVTFSEN